MAVTCWMRRMEVILTSKKFKGNITFNNFDPKHQFNMSITGIKKVATVQDGGTLIISNLEYDTIIQIMALEMYQIEIKVGYGINNNLQTYFKGEISFISQKIHSRHDTSTYFTFASSLVAAFSQARINFNINSGINIYSALNQVCYFAGIKNKNINPKLQNYLLTQTINMRTNTCNAIDLLLQNNQGEFMLNTDSSEDGNVINILNIKNARRVVLDPNSIQISKGNPTVNSDGLRVTVLPTFNFKPGDIIKIDNSLIDISVSSYEAVKTAFNANYMDRNGEYMILEINFNFESRGQNFDIDIKARALDIISQFQSR